KCWSRNDSPVSCSIVPRYSFQPFIGGSQLMIFLKERTISVLGGYGTVTSATSRSIIHQLGIHLYGFLPYVDTPENLTTVNFFDILDGSGLQVILFSRKLVLYWSENFSWRTYIVLTLGGCVINFQTVSFEWNSTSR
ncbi:putative protein orph-D2, partial [Microplitis demolitor]